MRRTRRTRHCPTSAHCGFDQSSVQISMPVEVGEGTY